MSPNLRWNQDVIFTSKIVDNRCFMFMSKFLVYIQFFFFVFGIQIAYIQAIYLFQVPYLYSSLLFIVKFYIFVQALYLCSGLSYVHVQWSKLCWKVKPCVNASILCWTFNFYVLRFKLFIPKLCWDQDVILTFKMRCSCVSFFFWLTLKLKVWKWTMKKILTINYLLLHKLLPFFFYVVLVVSSFKIGWQRFSYKTKLNTKINLNTVIHFSNIFCLSKFIYCHTKADLATTPWITHPLIHTPSLNPTQLICCNSLLRTHW